MGKYQEGTVFELFIDDNTEYVVLKELELENNVYLVVSQLYGKKNNFGINPQNLLILCVDPNTDKMELIKDEEIIRKVIGEVFIMLERGEQDGK